MTHAYHDGTVSVPTSGGFAMNKTLTIKNMPEKLYKRLKASAKANHRSLNKEIIACVEKAAPAKRMTPKEILASVNAFREKWKGPPITDEFLNWAKNEGRP